MRFLYVAPRYHTNQIPIMKGLKENGHEVFFFSHYAGRIEDYTYVNPEIIGYSGVFQLINYFYVNLLHRKNPQAADWKLLHGFPPVMKMYRRIKECDPNVVIIRERSVYSIVTYLLCVKCHRKAILYNQSPVYGVVKKDIAHRLINKITPKVRMTPVMGKEDPDCEIEKNVVFVPFVMEAKIAPKERTYCPDGVIRIFTVGKYEERKNLLMMAEIMKELSKQYKIHLIIAGECSTEFHKRYYNKLKEYISENHLENVITLYQNLERKEMERLYENTDLFVLPSTREPASISQLEAMAFSVPVICSDTNGSSCYVKNGHNGYLFRDNDINSLKETIKKILDHPCLLSEMGNNSFLDIKEKYQFENYYEGIMKCLQCIEEQRKR